MRSGEHGNIVYYLLFGIIVLAALSVAVSRGWRTSLGSLISDRQRLAATEVIGYGDAVSKAVTQLRLRGVRFDQLSFADPDLSGGYGTYGTAPEYEIFNPDGGGVTYKAPPAEAMAGTGDYIFTAANAIDEIGTTCAANGCADLIMMAGPLNTDVCKAINVLLNVTNPAGAPPVNTTADTTTLFAGTAHYNATIGNQAGSVALQGKTAACFTKSATSENYFYQVLVPQ